MTELQVGIEYRRCHGFCGMLVGAAPGQTVCQFCGGVLATIRQTRDSEWR